MLCCGNILTNLDMSLQNLGSPGIDLGCGKNMAKTWHPSDPRPHWSSAKSPIGELLRMTATDPIQDGDRTNLTKYIKYVKICLFPKV